MCPPTTNWHNNTVREKNDGTTRTAQQQQQAKTKSLTNHHRLTG